MKMLTLPLLLCVMTALARAVDVSCPDNWTPLNGRCFGYVLTPMTWADAEKNCVSMGGHLASVHSAQEHQDIQSLIWSITRDYKGTWIGGSDSKKEGVWTWTDGTSLKFKNWCPGEPSNGGRGSGQNCLQINYSGKRCWDDDWCHVKYPSVCSK